MDRFAGMDSPSISVAGAQKWTRNKDAALSHEPRGRRMSRRCGQQHRADVTTASSSLPPSFILTLAAFEGIAGICGDGGDSQKDNQNPEGHVHVRPLAVQFWICGMSCDKASSSSAAFGLETFISCRDFLTHEQCDRRTETYRHMTTDDDEEVVKILRFFAVEADGHAFPIQIVQACGRTDAATAAAPFTRDPSAPPTALTVI